jgi:hypothetical protein
MTEQSKMHLNNLKIIIDATVQKGGFFKCAQDVVNLNKSFEYAVGRVEVADLMEEKNYKLNGPEKSDKSIAGITE